MIFLEKETMYNSANDTGYISTHYKETPYSQSLIDLMCISDQFTENIVQTGVQSAGLSNHSVVYAIIKGKYQPLSKKISKYCSFKNFDSDKFEEVVSKN